MHQLIAMFGRPTLQKNIVSKLSTVKGGEKTSEVFFLNGKVYWQDLICLGKLMMIRKGNHPQMALIQVSEL